MFGWIMSKIFIFIFLLVNFMVKDKSFTQPDGIGITFSKEDLKVERDFLLFFVVLFVEQKWSLLKILK